MSRVDFYHLQSQTLENVLPKLLEKAYETGKSVLVRVGNEERVEFLNALLWTYNDQSFLPHGSKKDGNAELQPIWLTSGTDNPNMASLCFWLTAPRQTTVNWKNSPAFLTFLTETHLTPCNRPGPFLEKSEKRRQRMFLLAAGCKRPLETSLIFPI